MTRSADAGPVALIPDRVPFSRINPPPAGSTLVTAQTGTDMTTGRVLRLGDDRTDAELLHAHIAGGDPAALDVLARRHAPMVWGVCRRTLGRGPDAEDAFQATFLVLVRRAAAVAVPELVGNWLYGVALRTARKAKAAAGRRRTVALPETPAPPPGPWDDVLPLLDAELDRLPDRYRTVLLLCDLQRKTRAEAARALGVPPGTVAARVARGRALLAARLTRRGVGAPAAAVAGLVAPRAGATPVVVRPTALTLSDEVHRAMTRTTILIAAARAAGFAAVLVFATAVAAGLSAQPDPPRPAPPPAAPKTAAPAWQTAYVLTHDHPVTALACSADRLAAGDAGGNLFLCDTPTGKNRVRKLRGAPPGTPDALRDYDQLAFTADAKKLFFTRQNQSSVWFTHPADADEKAWGVGGGTVFLDLAADATAWLEGHGKSLLVRPNIYLPSGEPVDGATDYEAAIRYKAAVERAAFSPDGTWFAAHTADGKLHVHDRAARDGTEFRPAATTIEVGKQSLTALAFAPGGARLAAIGDGGFARVYDAKTGRETAALKGHPGIVFCAAFAPDGKTLVTGGDDGVVRVWDAATGRVVAVLRGHTDSVRVAAFDPAGRVLLTGSADKTVRAWTPPR